MIKLKMRKVWFSPARGRHFFTRRAAIRAEAHQKIIERYPNERPDYDMGVCIYPGYSFKFDEPEKYQKMLRRLMHIIERSTAK